MPKELRMILENIKTNISIVTLAVFMLSGAYLLLVDKADLLTKGLKWESKVATIIGYFYIFGSFVAFILFKYIIM